MNKSTRYSPEVRERAVRMVFEHQDQYESQWAAMASIAEKIGCTTESLRKWVRQAERDQGRKPGLTTELLRLKPDFPSAASPDISPGRPHIACTGAPANVSTAHAQRYILVRGYAVSGPFWTAISGMPALPIEWSIGCGGRARPGSPGTGQNSAS